VTQDESWVALLGRAVEQALEEGRDDALHLLPDLLLVLE
jgi:hypothetical protein